MSEHKKLTEQLDGLSHSAAIVVVTQKVEAIGQREAETREELMRVANRVTEIGKCLRRILDDLPSDGVNPQASECIEGMAEQNNQRLRADVEEMTQFIEHRENLAEQENDRLRKRNEGLETKLLCSKGRIKKVEGQINLCCRWNIDLHKQVAELESQLRKSRQWAAAWKVKAKEQKRIIKCVSVLNERVMQADLCGRLERRNAELEAGIKKVVETDGGGSCWNIHEAVRKHLYPLATKEAADDRA